MTVRGAYVLARANAESEFTIDGAPEGRVLDQEKVRPVNRALADVDTGGREAAGVNFLCPMMPRLLKF